MSGYPGNRPHHSNYGPPSGAPPNQNYYQQPNGPPPSQYQNQYQPPPHFPPPQNYQNQYQPPPPQQQQFQQSGKRKALLIGINYVGTSSALAGCHNDAMNLQNFIMNKYNYQQSDVVMLMDRSGAGQRELPTKENIFRACQWLVSNAAPGDSFFFHYSGHGGSVADKTGLEDDGMSETILPLDFKQTGEILDTDLHNLLVKPLPPGARLTAIFDSCHSGTALNLPYLYSTHGTLKEQNLLAEAGQGGISAFTSYARGDFGGVFSAVKNLGNQAMNGKKSEESNRRANSSNADVLSFSGCKDSQTSADASEAGKATGAMSWAFVTALEKNPSQSYNQLLVSIRNELAGRYDQKPQLSCSHPLDCNLLMII